MTGWRVDKNTSNKIRDKEDPRSTSYQKSAEEINSEYVSKFDKMMPDLIKYASYWRQYPDAFIDMISTKDTKIKLFFYQRLFLRAVMRHRYVYATFTRAFSKSFLSILALYLKCIFYPGTKLFICSGGI